MLLLWEKNIMRSRKRRDYNWHREPRQMGGKGMKQALTLAGGGAKGAYEIGVYKALDELGFQFDIITGTSIGAVNGAMLVQGDAKKAMALWESLTIDKVMESNGLSFNDSNNIEYYLSHREELIPLVKNYFTSKGMDITPFKNMLNEYLNEEKFFKSDTDFGLMTVHYPSLSPEEITKQEIQPGYLAKWVLASASCFPAFPVCEIDGSRYIDGMYYDNVPIDTAFRLGADQVVAVTLKAGVSQNKYVNHPLVTYIEPSRPLGMALAFENETMTQNIRLGYHDAMKTFGEYFGNAYTFVKSREQKYQATAKSITQKIVRLEALESPEKQRIAKLKGSATPLSDYLNNMRVPNRQDISTYFACIVETYMNLFGYNIYTEYRIRDVLAELLQRAKASDPEPQMIQLLAARAALKDEKAFEAISKQYKPEILISALLLMELE